MWALWAVLLMLWASLYGDSRLRPEAPLPALALSSSTVILLGVALYILVLGICHVMVARRHGAGVVLMWALVPPAAAFGVGLLLQDLGVVVVSALAAVGAGAALIYRRYVARTVTNDAGAAAPLTVLVVLYFSLSWHAHQQIPAATLSQFFGVLLQSALVLAGLVFTFALFFAERSTGSRSSLSEGLGGFLQLFALLSLLSTVGLLVSGSDVTISAETLSSPATFFTLNSLGVVVFTTTLGAFLACLAYLVLMLELFRAESRRT